jgi:hypothetical protein
MNESEMPWIRQGVEKQLDFIYTNREKLLKAFIAETGLLPSQIVMVQQNKGTTVKIWFEKKEAVRYE